MVAEGGGEDTVVVEQAQVEVMVQQVRVLLLYYSILFCPTVWSFNMEYS